MANRSSEGQPRVQWQSVRWPDKSTYEGLVKDDKCHVRGVFKYSNGDRYEGEFEDNNMSGYGVYVWGAEGSVYRGQAGRGWRSSMMDGCGVKITKQSGSTTYLAEEGEFVNDEWVGSAMACTVEQARAAAAEADRAAQMARVFELGRDSGDSAAALARAHAAAAAAAAETAQPAKLRRHQQQRQPREEEPAAGSSAPSPAAATPVQLGLPHAQHARQLQQQGPLALLQEAAAGVQQAAQQALQRLQGLLPKSQQQAQQAQGPPAS
ncbi:hypothetical protein ABPG77_005420 [Micractinium sp. CCAP 211/92]